MKTREQIDYIQGQWFDIKNLRRYKDKSGAVYFIGSNVALKQLYDILDKSDLTSFGHITPRYDVHPLMNDKRSYGLEIKDGKFCIVTAEKLVEKILKSS